MNGRRSVLTEIPNQKCSQVTDPFFSNETARERTQELLKKTAGERPKYIFKRKSVQARCVVKKKRWRGAHRVTSSRKEGTRERTTVGEMEETGSKKAEKWNTRKRKSREKENEKKSQW